MKRKLALGVGVLVAVLAAGAGAVRAYMVWQQSRDVLPEFVDVPPGPRAPRRELLGLEIGRTTVDEAKALASARGAVCGDSSMRALMQAKRDATKRKMKEAEARGDDPDGVTGASLANYRSKKERNPQVRLACDRVPLAGFDDRHRVDGDPLYWLIIFDSPEHGLRHTSVTRRVDPALAAEEWAHALDAMTKRFGAPTTLKGPGNSDGADDFAPGTRYEATWAFADLEAQLTAFRISDSVRFTERAEVPWPIRVEP